MEKKYQIVLKKPLKPDITLMEIHAPYTYIY